MQPGVPEGRRGESGPLQRARERVLARLPALLLVAVALHQIWLAHGAQLSAWTGGGFGMFASTDAWGRRHLHAWAIAADGTRRELAIPEALGSEEQRALALPDERRLRALALALAALEAEGALDEAPPPYPGELRDAWPPDAGELPDTSEAPGAPPPRATAPPGAPPPAPAEPPVAIAIEVFAVRYDRATLGPSGERIAALAVPLPGR